MTPRFTWIDLLSIVFLFIGALFCLTQLNQTEFFQPLLASIKILYLVAAVVTSVRIVTNMEKEQDFKRGWRFIVLGLGFYAFGQIILGTYQFRNYAAPFPSIADIFFVIAMPLLLVALMMFLKNFFSSGLPLGSVKRYWIYGGLILFIISSLLYIVLGPMWVDGTRSVLERFVNSYYTVSTGLLIIPAIILVRMSWRFRGGRIIWGWAVMMLGFIAIFGADILFTFKSVNMLSQQLYHVMTFLYLFGYIALFRGIYFHYQMFRQER